jgi:GR25 family glycosyltransferase involved in LPS biosynthesis
MNYLINYIMIKVIDCETPIYVNKIFCINLEKDIDRKKNMIERLKIFNLENKVEFIKGIYDKEHPTIGCRSSHFSIIKKAYLEKIDNIMIMEDDAEFYEFPFKIDDNIPEEWGMIYPGWLDVNLKSFKYSKNLIKLKSGRSTFCYILNIKSYPYILRMMGCNEHIDIFYSQVIQNSMNCYGLYPVKVFQTLNISNISGFLNNKINDRIKNNALKVYNKEKPTIESNEWFCHYKRFMENFNNNYDMEFYKLMRLKF